MSLYLISMDKSDGMIPRPMHGNRMSNPDTTASSSNSSPPSRGFPIAALLLVLYAVVLSRGIAQPWTGLHDWNGAFYSQLARNLLRYPFSMHHGMPVVAVGPETPADGEWCFYSTHPPGLVWFIAASFRLWGEHEWAARLVPILFSLAALALLYRAVAARYGELTACTTGAIYALLPMAAFFGRMPDQEAPCLFLMLAAALAADRQLDPAANARSRLRPGFVWAVCITAAIWTDWVAIILAGLVGLRAVIEVIRGRIPLRLCAQILAAPVFATISLLIYLVYFGLDGRASDLLAIFTSRAGVSVGENDPAPHAHSAWTHTLENLTPPVIVLAAIGIVFGTINRIRATPDDKPVRRRTFDGLTLLAITGALWVAIFWRQYLVHQYWLAYLGPAIALLAANGLIALHSALAALVHRTAKPVTALVGVTTVAFAFVGINDLFERTHVQLSDVNAWRATHAELADVFPPQQYRGTSMPRLLLIRSPIRLEQRGHYELRNIVPPHFAYYLDYPFEVETDIDQAVRNLPDRAGLLIHGLEAQRHWPTLQPLQSTASFHTFGNWQFIISHHQEARD